MSGLHRSNTLQGADDEHFPPSRWPLTLQRTGCMHGITQVCSMAGLHPQTLTSVEQARHI